LKSPLIEDALLYGRIISFDFSKNPRAIVAEEDVEHFFPHLMIYFLCRLFDKTLVDGIKFEGISSFSRVKTFTGKQKKFNEWLQEWRVCGDAEGMMKEYIRLTMIAFKTDSQAPPVFLLDEIQSLCRPTSLLSTLDSSGAQMHSFLSLLLSQLARKIKPLCICTGTNSGKIISLIEKSTLIPHLLSLTPLNNDYWKLWTQLTEYAHQNNSDFSFIDADSDKDLILALVYASYQIPRLLFLAHSIWFELRMKRIIQNRLFFIQQFENKAIEYYSEMANILKLYDTNTIAHLILACGVFWRVPDIYENVPGTSIPWSEFIEKAIIFPYQGNTFMFPFGLIWKVADSPEIIEKKKEIESRCSHLIQNLEIRNLFVSYDDLRSFESYNLGLAFETLFASSLAAKYCLLTASKQLTGLVPLFAIYDIQEDALTLDAIKNFSVDLSDGIHLPEAEMFVNSSNKMNAVIHNRLSHNAHHDIILPATSSQGHDKIAVSVKASFITASKDDIEKQLFIFPKAKTNVAQLFWLSLGDKNQGNQFNSVAFLNGRGCCNGLTLDFYEMIKKLRSLNQKPA
jgi:hypothetical protein